MSPGVSSFARVILLVGMMFPLAFVFAYFVLPSERTVVVTGLTDEQVRSLEAVSFAMQRVTEESADQGVIEDGAARFGRLDEDQTLWRMPSRWAWAGLSMNRELEAFDGRLGDRFTLERRPNRWADSVFVALLLIAVWAGLRWNQARRSTPPAR
jgi:hypothetical protein